MRAIISVSDKRNVVWLGRGLQEVGVEVFSTGGTLRALEVGGVEAKSVSTLTGFPEILGGRVKTLHPAVHGGILHRREHADDVAEVAAHGIAPIDIVVVNLYPFRETVAAAGVTMDDALEHIDIGGPTMLRAAAKNFPSVLVVVDPDDYDDLINALRIGEVPREYRQMLAAKAFAHVAAYDSAIAGFLTPERFPRTLPLAFTKVEDLRYGENPHQAAAFYREEQDVGGTIAGARQLQGKALSYTNLLDADAALEIMRANLTMSSPAFRHAIRLSVALATAVLLARSSAFADSACAWTVFLRNHRGASL
ncbi:MAG: hypothetical protein NVS4B8_29840 [Herpetosiphon sp.]